MRRLVSVRGIDARLHLQSCLSAGMRTLCALCLLFTCVLTATAAAKERYPFAVTSARSGTGQTLIGRNRGPAPVSVRLMLANAENVSSGQPLPVYAVVRPYSEMLLLQVRRSDPRRSQRFATESTYQLGSFLAVPDARAVYRLPYENGRGFVISQAADGPLTTHHGEDSRYAVDFRMPENTPIVAARAGVVIATESHPKSSSPGISNWLSLELRGVARQTEAPAEGRASARMSAWRLISPSYRLTSTTTRPRTWPSSSRAPTSIASDRPISVVRASSREISRSRARRPQAS
jgi:hypothetical protein